MRLLKVAALAVAMIGGSLGLTAGGASAAPAANALTTAEVQGLAEHQAQYYYGGPRRYYGGGGYYRSPRVVRRVYRPYRPVVVRPYYNPYRPVVRRAYRPYRPVGYYRPVYRYGY